MYKQIYDNNNSHNHNTCNKRTKKLASFAYFYPSKFMNSMSYKYGLWNGYGKRITKIKDWGCIWE